MIITYKDCQIKHQYSDKHNTCSSYSCSQFSITFTDFCVLPLLAVHSINNHFGSSISSLGYDDLVLFGLH